jgi:hypothetical protein
MSLIKCHECGKEISTEATACPSCGANVKKPGGCLLATIIIMAGALLISAVTTHESPSPPPPQKTKEQVEADEKREIAFQKVVIAIRGVKEATRNPDSIVWEAISANSDATVVCIKYRGQNGFGGMSREFVVFAKGKASQSPNAWNKYCANKSLIDMMHAKYAL